MPAYSNNTRDNHDPHMCKNIVTACIYSIYQQRITVRLHSILPQNLILFNVCIIIIIIIIIIIFVITFMWCICSYIAETNPVSKVCSVAAVLYSRYVLHVMLFWNIFYALHLYFMKQVCRAQHGCFFSSWISCFPAMLPRYRVNDLEMFPFAPVISGIGFAFTSHLHGISLLLLLLLNDMYVSCHRHFFLVLLLNQQ